MAQHSIGEIIESLSSIKRSEELNCRVDRKIKRLEKLLKKLPILEEEHEIRKSINRILPRQF